MWTKSQKISGAVLGLAVVAFGVDRWVLSAPAGAAEAEVAATELVVSRPATAVARKANSAEPATPAATPAPAITLANRLTALGVARRFDFEPVGDAFRVAPEWLPPVPGETAAASGKAPAASAAKRVKPKVNHAAVFAGKHRLTAVMSNDGGGKVIVDGRFYVPGQQVDGFKLTEVGDGYATFAGRGTKVTLRVRPAAGANPAVADAR